MPDLPAVGDLAEPFTLDDQFQHAHAVAFGAGGAVVLVFADRDCADAVEPWARALSDGLGDRARVLGVAAVGAVPAFFQGAVRGFLHRKPSVLLDWGNRVSDRFGYAGGECAVVVIGGDGRIGARVRGRFTAERYAEAVRALGG